MTKSMSLNARRELLASVRKNYLAADWANKGKILDGFVSATEYERKYAIQLLNNRPHHIVQPRHHASKKYDEQIRQSLVFIWRTANQICSKRLVPFLPELVHAMEKHGHLRLPADVRERLLKTKSCNS